MSRKFWFLFFVRDTPKQTRIHVENQCHSSVLHSGWHSVLIGGKYSITSLWGKHSLHLCLLCCRLSVMFSVLLQTWGNTVFTRWGWHGKSHPFFNLWEKWIFWIVILHPSVTNPVRIWPGLASGAMAAGEDRKVQQCRQQAVWSHPTCFCRKWG